MLSLAGVSGAPTQTGAWHKIQIRSAFAGLGCLLLRETQRLLCKIEPKTASNKQNGSH